MTILTRSVTLNAAFMDEIKQDNQELKRLLEEGDVVFSSAARPKRAEALLSEMRDQLAMHFALEEAFGYFEDAVEVAPRLSRETELLQAEHSTLYQLVCGLVEQIAQLCYHEGPPSQIRSIAAGYAEFRERLNGHEARERKLMLDALDEELGVGD